MTENESKAFLEIEKQCINRNCDRNCAKCDIVQKVEDLNSAYDTAIKALEEVQQYRAIGTPEELKAAMKYVYLAKQHGTVGQVIENCVKYEEIGTPEECRAAVEKQTAKKPDYEGDGYSDGQLVYDTWICPSCGKHYEVDYDRYDYCPNCGQKINEDWSDEE